MNSSKLLIHHNIQKSSKFNRKYLRCYWTVRSLRSKTMKLYSNICLYTLACDYNVIGIVWSQLRCRFSLNGVFQYRAEGLLIIAVKSALISEQIISFLELMVLKWLSNKFCANKILAAEFFLVGNQKTILLLYLVIFVCHRR